MLNNGRNKCRVDFYLKRQVQIFRYQNSCYSHQVHLTLIHSAIELKQASEVSLCKMLKKKGLTLLFKTMQEPSDIELRRLAAKLLCVLAYNNEESQTYICNHSNFTQLTDKVAINPIPQHIKEQIKQNPQILQEIKEAKPYVNNALYWSYPAYDKNEDEDEEFPDPLHYLIGFYSYGAECLPSKKRRKSFVPFTRNAGTLNKRCNRPLSIQMRQRDVKECIKGTRTSSTASRYSKEINYSSKRLESVLEEGIKVQISSKLHLRPRNRRISAKNPKRKAAHENLHKTQKLALRPNVRQPKAVLSATQVIGKAKVSKQLEKEHRMCTTTRHTSKVISLGS
eukprot:TRINITY_DN2825_c0_g3_i3.p1 TRINITY_DN2825_c0_g3~~TRINITY_DN2825_c0_g3_i3.p1  ORF type:complete len:338 (+),score=28.66 TRINITY_DN2825_c0_g3_i3:108-1121(+)